MSQYTHLPIEEPVEFLCSSYWVTQEDKIPFGDKEVLCIVRETSSVGCCSGYCSPGFTSVLIPGFIKKFKYTTGEDGLFISEVEPIQDEKMIEEIKKIVVKKYHSPQIEFSGSRTS